MSRNFETVPHRAGLVEMKRLLLNSPHDAFFVIDDEERLVGTLTFDDLRLVAREQGLDDLVNARDVCRPCPIVLLARQTLDHVLSHLDSTGDEQLAVVHQLDNMRVVGVVQRKDVVLAHNRALLQAHAEEHD
jgi:CIC family chloride channel protein